MDFTILHNIKMYVPEYPTSHKWVKYIVNFDTKITHRLCNVLPRLFCDKLKIRDYRDLETWAMMKYEDGD